MRGCQDFKHSFLQLSSWVPGGTDPSCTTVGPPPEKGRPRGGRDPQVCSWGRQGAWQRTAWTDAARAPGPHGRLWLQTVLRAQRPC